MFYCVPVHAYTAQFYVQDTVTLKRDKKILLRDVCSILAVSLVGPVTAIVHSVALHSLRNAPTVSAMKNGQLLRNINERARNKRRRG